MNKIRRRIGFFLEGERGTINPSILNKDFNDVCYAELNKYVEFIFKLQPILISYEAIELSYSELLALIEKYDHHFAGTNVKEASEIDILLGYFVEASQKITNLLSSVTSFLSCSEVRLKKEFGKNSPELNKWNEQRRSLYSENFEYRFLYEMRNYSQHQYLPVSNIGIKLDNMAIGDRTTLNSIVINRDELLNSGYNWPKGLKDDISMLCEQVDVKPIFKKYISSIRKISFEYIAIYKSEILECQSYMSSLRRVFAFPENSTPVIYIGETPYDQPVPNKMEFIPYYQFRWLSKHFLQLSQHAART